MPAPISRALVMVLLATCLSCDLDDYAAPEPSRECRESGALCKLESGPLGVCESRPCTTGESPPCFTCTPQH